MSKTLNKTYLYTKYPDYEKKLYMYLMSSEEIDKDAPSFDNISYEVKKRQISNALASVLTSKNVVLMLPGNPLPKSFKVTVMKDIKGDKKLKVFIDCYDVITKENGLYVCNDHDIDKFIAYLINAMTSMIYTIDAKRLVNQISIREDGADCFSKLFTHIIDYICKISVMSGVKDRCIYLSAMYYLSNILENDEDSTSTKAIAKKLSGLSTREEEILWMDIDEDTFLNIKFFVNSLSKILRIPAVTLDTVVEKWMYLYGVSTTFGLEMFPNFAAMITDAYVGCYINNQKTIEKITGRSMVSFSKNILTIGEGAV